MKVYLGETGVKQSFQKPFPITTNCELYENKGEGSYWVHDAIALIVYLCKECFEPNVRLNQP
jgi:hypothetical protein